MAMILPVLVCVVIVCCNILFLEELWLLKVQIQFVYLLQLRLI